MDDDVGPIAAAVEVVAFLTPPPPPPPPPPAPSSSSPSSPRLSLGTFELPESNLILAKLVRMAVDRVCGDGGDVASRVGSRSRTTSRSCS